MEPHGNGFGRIPGPLGSCRDRTRRYCDLALPAQFCIYYWNNRLGLGQKEQGKRTADRDRRNRLTTFVRRLFVRDREERVLIRILSSAATVIRRHS